MKMKKVDAADIKKKSAFKRLLDEHNTTSYQLAKESGLAERHLYKIEAGDIDIMKMTATNIQALARAFDMTTDEFIEFVSSK